MKSKYYIKGEYILFGNEEKRESKIKFKFYNKEEGEWLVNLLNSKT